MAGGSGTRFWPVSTSKSPKQFHDILGTGKTLLQQTFERLNLVIPSQQIYIITLKEYVDFVKKQLPQLSEDQIIAEPTAMNTAPCNLYASLKIHEFNPEAKLVIAPADHIILNESVFADKLKLALKKAKEKDVLITLGVKPTRPDTGYGYIQFIEDESQELKKVKTFTEKPNLELAESFIESGDFLWNSGIFIWSAKSIISAFKKYLPEMHESFAQIKYNINSNEGLEEIERIYPFVQFISIDNGIMEKAENVYVIPSSFGWSDLGTWTSFYENSDKDENGNIFRSRPIIANEVSNSIVYTTHRKAVVISGLENYIVVDTPKALLICPRNKDQDIKTYVNELKLNKGDKFV